MREIYLNHNPILIIKLLKYKLMSTSSSLEYNYGYQFVPIHKLSTIYCFYYKLYSFREILFYKNQ